MLATGCMERRYLICRTVSLLGSSDAMSAMEIVGWPGWRAAPATAPRRESGQRDA